MYVLEEDLLAVRLRGPSVNRERGVGPHSPLRVVFSGP